MKRSPQIVTFGCRINAYESEVIRGALSESGVEDMVVVNTCSVTKEAKDKPDKPSGAPGETIPRRKLSSPAVRPKSIRAPMPPCPRSTAC